MAMLCHTEYALQKKEQIENSLLNLMETQQYQHISVTDICQEADIPRRTFYHYFENKEGVLDSIVESLMRQCFLNTIFDFWPNMEHTKDTFVQIFRFWEGDNRKILDILMHNNLESKLISCSTKWSWDEQLRMHLKVKQDPKLVEIILMIGITDFFTLLFHWSRGGYRETPEEMGEYAVSILPQALFNK